MKMASLFHSMSSVFLLFLVLSCCAIADDRKVHIAYMGSLPKGNYSAFSHHLDILQKVLVNSFPAENALVRSYNRSFNGFAALLTDQEGHRLAGMKNIVSVFPSQIYDLHTTRSWDFMGFKGQNSAKPSNGSDVIIGVLDTGIWPESESFSDEGFGPSPKRWKGDCKGGKLKGKPFKCNNKIIGARYYTGDSAHDVMGHGTHTASTAAGNNVKDASFYGLAQGIARGGLPSARIAAYGVCTWMGCQNSDILAAFDDAIADGVDVITISIGTREPIQLRTDVIAIGGFHAMVKGILTVQSAGNSGPALITVSSSAPWLLSVAASSIDRRFVDKVTLGDGRTIVGNSINSFTLNETNYPLVYGKEVTERCSEMRAQTCEFGCVDRAKVAGKIVLCRNFYGTYVTFATGAVGAIALHGVRTDVSYINAFPVSTLSDEDINSAVSYFNSSSQPTANILKSETIADSSAPIVASFSSRGPNVIVRDIMKPDVVAPGIDILAAFSPLVSPSGNDQDKRRVNFSILSGTSMSCPHAAGVAAYVRSVHPDWSPAAIKSAIMTTAWPMNATANPDAEFSYGSGHINPSKAIDPGLVYDANREDYIEMLCSVGYEASVIRLITGDNSTTCKDKSRPTINLNYPAMTSHCLCINGFKVTFNRTVTNVGPAKSTYKVTVNSGNKLHITVVPQVLSFESLNETKSFQVTVTVVGNEAFGEKRTGSLVWSDGTRSVRSPIVLYAVITT